MSRTVTGAIILLAVVSCASTTPAANLEGVCESRSTQAKLCKSGGFVDVEVAEMIDDKPEEPPSFIIIPNVDVHIAYKRKIGGKNAKSEDNGYSKPVKMGTAPFSGCCLKPGPVRISVAVDEYGSATKDAFIVPGKVVKLMFQFGTLKPKGTWVSLVAEQDYGTIIIANTRDVPVYIDEEEVETDDHLDDREKSGSLVISRVPAGPRSVRVGKEGKSLSIRVVKGKTVRVRADEKGSLQELK